MNNNIYTSNTIQSSKFASNEVVFLSNNEMVMKVCENGDIEFKNGFTITPEILESLMNGKSFLISKCDDGWYVNNHKVDDVDSAIASEIAKKCLTEEDTKIEDILQIKN